MSTVRNLAICDDCSLVPYDLRIGVVDEWNYDDLDEWEEAEARAKQERISFMVRIGADLKDHNCTVKNAPELDFQCDCSCNPGRFEWHRKRRREARRT